MVDYKRSERVGNQIRMEIAEILMSKVKDPVQQQQHYHPWMRLQKKWINYLQALKIISIIPFAGGPIVFFRWMNFVLLPKK